MRVPTCGVLACAAVHTGGLAAAAAVTIGQVAERRRSSRTAPASPLTCSSRASPREPTSTWRSRRERSPRGAPARLPAQAELHAQGLPEDDRSRRLPRHRPQRAAPAERRAQHLPRERPVSSGDLIGLNVSGSPNACTFDVPGDSVLDGTAEPRRRRLRDLQPPARIPASTSPAVLVPTNSSQASTVFRDRTTGTATLKILLSNPAR